jgi:hypothetical protein
VSEATAFRERELIAVETQPLRASCCFCKWTFEGTTAEAREAARKHRLKKHPEKNVHRSKRGVKSLSSFRYIQMDEKDKEEIEQERRKRAKLHGVTIEVAQIEEQVVS